MSSNDQYIVMGQLGAPHGIKGFVKVQSFARPESNLFEYQPWFIEQKGGWKKVSVSSVARHAKKWVVQLEQCTDRDSAQALTGKSIAVLREALPEPEDGSYYWHDLIGLEVKHKDGHHIGVVKDFLETGANDVMIVRTADGLDELIPFVFEHYIMEISIESKTITVNWSIEE